MSRYLASEFRSLEPSAKRTRSPDRIWFVQALRGVAVILVLADHLLFSFWVDNGSSAAVAHVAALPTDAWTSLWHLEPHVWLVRHEIVIGTIGVALFFLVSGFVIPISLERKTLLSFAQGRLARIYPVWIAGIVLSAGCVWFYGNQKGSFFPYSTQELVNSAFLINDLAAVPNINPISWTLMVELKFYILCMLMAPIGYLHRSGGTIVAALLLTLVCAWFNTASIQDAMGLNIPAAARAVSLWAPFLIFMLIGTCFANIFSKQWTLLEAGSTVMALAFLTYACLKILNYPTYVTISFALAAICFVASYLGSARLPYSRVLNWLANISYPLYAIHYLCGFVLLTYLFTATQSAYLAILATIAIILSVAAMVHYFLERPLLQIASGSILHNTRAVLRLQRRRYRVLMGESI
jgi:peptidoglycan/LPS O-acetylase OafA/YrhL